MLLDLEVVFDPKHYPVRAGALVWWLWEETNVPKVVGSNPSTVK